jgi:hypothetical protein
MIMLSENKMSYSIEKKLCGLSLNLNYMNTHTHINTIKGTIGQSGPMVFVYMNKISWISKKSINSKKEGLLQTILHIKMEYTVG